MRLKGTASDVDSCKFSWPSLDQLPILSSCRRISAENTRVPIVAFLTDKIPKEIRFKNGMVWLSHGSLCEIVRPAWYACSTSPIQVTQCKRLHNAEIQS